MRTSLCARLARVVCYSAVSALPLVASAQVAPSESLVSAQRDLIDFEFSQSRAAIAWCDKDGNLWTADVNRDTGLFVPSNGKGTLVDADAMTTGDLALITKSFEAATMKQRADTERLNTELEGSLKARGLAFNRPDKKPFRDALSKAGFYAGWKQKYGPEAWGILEKYAGNLS